MTNQSEPLSQLALIRKYVDAHDLGEGSELADRLLDVDPGNIDAMVEKITLWFTCGTPDVVSEDGARIHELAPGSAADLFAQVMAQSEGIPPNSIELLDQALKIDPSFERAWFAKGYILVEDQQYQQAVEALDRALLLNPLHAIALYKAGLAKHSLGDYWGAVKNLTTYTMQPGFCDRLRVFITLADCFTRLSEQEIRNEQEWRNHGSTGKDGPRKEEESSPTIERSADEENEIIIRNPMTVKAPFLRMICDMIDAQHMMIPLDVVLLNASLKEAAVIDIDDSLRRIMRTDREEKTHFFSELVDAVPPVVSDNLFVQFRSDSIHTDVTKPGWIGVHMVNFKIAGDSMILENYKLVPYDLSDFSHIFAMVFYEEKGATLKVDQYGVILGVRETDGASYQGYFPLTGEDPGKPGDLEIFLRYILTMTYHMFSCFQLVNQGEAGLKYEDGIYKI